MFEHITSTFWNLDCSLLDRTNQLVSNQELVVDDLDYYHEWNHFHHHLIYFLIGFYHLRLDFVNHGTCYSNWLSFDRLCQKAFIFNFLMTYLFFDQIVALNFFDFIEASHYHRCFKQVTLSSFYYLYWGYSLHDD